MGTISEYSHAILYVGGSSFIDSDTDGVHSNNLQRLIFKGHKDAIVRRYRSPLASSKLKSICDDARAQIGQRYSKREAIQTALPEMNCNASERQFCSRLVAQAYGRSGIALVENADFCTPKQLFDSPLLIDVPDSTRKASEIEVKFALDQSRNPLKRQEEITNALLADIRRVSNTQISTVSEVLYLAASNPVLDPLIAGLLQSSGYLTMWEWDMALNPHWYDVEAYNSHIPIGGQWSQAELMLPSAHDALNRHRNNLNAISEVNGSDRSQTGELFAELERTLCRITMQRIEVLEAFYRP